jgi:hypothetical protein
MWASFTFVKKKKTAYVQRPSHKLQHVQLTLGAQEDGMRMLSV